jgi:hypothetical protein
MTYADKLNQAKAHYPFKRWHEPFEDRLEEQYTQENCDKMQGIFDDLIVDFVAKGDLASESEKVKSFRGAIKVTNKLNDRTGMIETAQREELCELIDIISLAVDLNSKNYGDGYGLADEWRDW